MKNSERPLPKALAESEQTVASLAGQHHKKDEAVRLDDSRGGYRAGLGSSTWACGSDRSRSTP